MRRTVLILPAALLAFASFATPAEAASFNCGGARTSDEVAICRTPSLSALDSEMGGLWYAYSRVPMYMGGRDARADEAQAFLVRRRACGRNVGCLTAAYRARIAELRRGIDSAMQVFFDLQNGT